MEVDQLSAAINDFGLSLFKDLCESSNGGNVAISPFSITAALGMILLGARGDTSAGISRALHWMTSDSDQERKLHEQIRDYLRLLDSKTDGYQVSCANRLYLDKRQTVLEEFRNATQGLYLAEPVAANFAEQAEVERESINAWVAEQTFNKVENLLTPGAVNSLTRLVLANALYFKGQWVTKFNEALTRPGPFKITPGVTKNVPFMRTHGRFPYVQDNDLQCTAVGLPYLGNDLDMVLLLPHSEFGLDELLTKLDLSSLNRMLSDMDKYPTKIYLSMPKFQVTSSNNLNEALSALGMHSAFQQAEADLGGISPSRDLYVSTVQHKVYVAVDEQGTQAAAATAVASNSFSAAPPEILADRPFLFAIRDKRAAGAMLFLGSVRDPQA